MNEEFELIGENPTYGITNVKGGAGHRPKTLRLGLFPNACRTESQ
jgi:hypothetical protein